MSGQQKRKVKRKAKLLPASETNPMRRVSMARWAPDEMALKRVFGEKYRVKS